MHNLKFRLATECLNARVAWNPPVPSHPVLSPGQSLHALILVPLVTHLTLPAWIHDATHTHSIPCVDVTHVLAYLRGYAVYFVSTYKWVFAATPLV